MFVAFLFWQLGFNYGARQSNDLLLTSPDAGTEVVQLRAQLEEGRIFQETLLNAVMASFAAGFTLLVLVNVGVIVLAQRNYELDEKAMRSVLGSETDEKIQAEATRSTNALTQTRRELNQRLDRRIAEVMDQLSKELTKVDTRLAESQKTELILSQNIESLRSGIERDLSRLQIETWTNAADQAEKNGYFHIAAELYSRIVIADSGGEWTRLFALMSGVPKILRNLKRMDRSLPVSRHQLEVIQQALALATNNEPLVGVGSQTIAEGLALVESILEQLPDDPYAVIPPPIVPPPQVPKVPPAPS